MPLYDFKCSNCDHEREEILSMQHELANALNAVARWKES